MTITRYRKRPVEVDTIEWTGSNINELIDFTGGDFRLVNPDDGDFAPDVTAKVYDRLHDTWVGVKTGQHVIHGVKGEFYPIDPEVLATTYEPASEAPQSSAQETIARVTALHEQWVKAGTPPLGVPLSRWWDARLAEQHAAINGPA